MIFSSGAYVDAAGAFLAWLGWGGGAAAFIGVWCCHLASQITKKQTNGYAWKAIQLYPQTVHAVIKLINERRTIAYCQKHRFVLRVLEKPSIVLMTRKSDTQTIGFHISHGMHLWCGAQQPMPNQAERE